MKWEYFMSNRDNFVEILIYDPILKRNMGRAIIKLEYCKLRKEDERSMSENLYELLSLAARYFFAGLMILIVARAWRITLIDSRRAKTLRRISPETGISGELLVLEGDERAKRGMKYPVIREGQIGSGRKADIRIRHSSVRRRHAYFILKPEGLSIRSHAGAPLCNGLGRAVKQILLRDGDEIIVGRVHLLLVLTHAPADADRRISLQRRRPINDDRYAPRFRDERPDDDLFNPDPDRMFRESPILRHEPDPLDADDFSDMDEEEMWWPDGKK